MASIQDTYNNLFKKLQDHAKKNNFHINTDNNLAKNLILALMKREKQYGSYYCPCKIVTGDKKVDKNIICPCANHKKDIEKQGHCHCHLFFKK